MVDGQAQPAPRDAESQRRGPGPAISDAGLRVSADQGLQAQVLSDHCVSGLPVPVPGRVSGVWDAGAGSGAGAQRKVAEAHGGRAGAGPPRAALRRIAVSDWTLGIEPGVSVYPSDDVRALQHAGLCPEPQGHADDRRVQPHGLSAGAGAHGTQRDGAPGNRLRVRQLELSNRAPPVSGNGAQQPERGAADRGGILRRTRGRLCGDGTAPGTHRAAAAPSRRLGAAAPRFAGHG